MCKRETAKINQTRDILKIGYHFIEGRGPEAARQDRVSEAKKRAEETKKRRWEAAAREGAAAAE